MTGSLGMTYSHEFFWCADNRTFACMLTADRRKRLGNRRIRYVYAIPGYQEVHSVRCRDSDVRSAGRSFTRDFARG